MRLAVIGAGNVGSSLTRAAIAAGHAVAVSATSAEKAAAVAAESGAQAATGNAEAVRDAEVVVLAVPADAATSVVEGLAPVLRGKVVVDASNPLNADFSDLDIEGTAAVQSLQRRAPEVPVIKAFNTIFAGRLARPVEDGVALDGYYAGDDVEAKQVVAELLESLGFRPVDVGGLRMARALEEMAFLNISLNAANGWSWQTGWKLHGPTA